MTQYLFNRVIIKFQWGGMSSLSEKTISCTCLLGPGLKLIFHSFTQAFILLMSLFKLVTNKFVIFICCESVWKILHIDSSVISKCPHAKFDKRCMEIIKQKKNNKITLIRQWYKWISPRDIDNSERILESNWTWNKLGLTHPTATSLDEYLHAKNLRYQLIPTSGVDDLRILQSDKMGETTGRTQWKSEVSDATFPWWRIACIKDLRGLLMLSKDTADQRIL